MLKKRYLPIVTAAIFAVVGSGLVNVLITKVAPNQQLASTKSQGIQSVFAATGTSYYVNCNGGNDSNNGTSQGSAWQSLAKASAATLATGDGLFLNRGCSWIGSLTVSWSGVTVSNYGSGALPIIQSTGNNVRLVNVTGSNNTIDGLQTNANAPSTDAGCANNPVGYVIGFSFAAGATNNVLKNSVATGAYAGVLLNSGSHDNHILYNQLTNNNMMSPLDQTPNNDAGAFGVALIGNNNEVAYNQIDGSYACSYDYGHDGSAVEVYNGSNNNVHHNKAVNDKVFTELGKDSAHTSDGNTYAYNQYTSSIDQGAFLNTRGVGNLGPITNTKAYNNVSYATGTGNGVICSSCGPDILTLKNNIIWADGKALYTNAAFNESNNIYWKTSGNPLIQGITINATSKKADPKFVSNGSNYHLQSSSPAINAGTSESVTAGYNKDLDGNSVPLSSAVDIGAYEDTSTTPPPPPPSDKIPPVISITTPSNSATVSGTIAVNATASDNVGVTKVDFLIDGATVLSDVTSPYSASWDTTSSSNTTHSLVAKAYDVAGNTTTSSLSVTVNNQSSGSGNGGTGPVQQPPTNVGDGTKTITPTNPLPTQDTSKVEVYVDGHLVGTAYNGAVPQIDASTLSNGKHEITVKAYGKNGKVAMTKQEITVNKKLSLYQKVRNRLLAAFGGKSSKYLNIVFIGSIISTLLIITTCVLAFKWGWFHKLYGLAKHELEVLEGDIHKTAIVKPDDKTYSKS